MKTDTERFWSKVQTGPDCWQWTGYLNRDGYGRIGLQRGKLILAHRLSYLLHVGDIPDGLEIDHLCRNRACVRPDHLDVVTHAENLRRSAHPHHQARRDNLCPRGHAFTPENTYVRPDGMRTCRTCQRASALARKQRLSGVPS